MKSVCDLSPLTSHLSPREGYSVIELIITMAIFLLMISIGTLSLLNIKHKSSLSSAVNSFSADFKEQQIKAMAGDSEGQSTISDQGVHFESTSYTLFRSSYILNGSGNFVVNLPDQLQFTNSNTQVIFAKGSGDASGVSSIVMKDTDGSQKTITVNSYGVITGVN